MAHHSSEIDPTLAQLFGRPQELPDFGATGKFPEGKLNATDEGEIQFGIAADVAANTVVLNFGTPVVWLGLTPAQAIAIADSLKANALKCQMSELSRHHDLATGRKDS